MKVKLLWKTLLAILFLLPGVTSNAQEAHFELGFGSTLPSGWVADGIFMTTTASNRNTEYSGTFGGSHAVKILKPFTITTKGYYTAGTLSFWLMSKQTGVDSLVVEKSNDGGNTWTKILSVVSDVIFPYTNYTVDINDNSPSVKLRFSSGDAKEFYMDDLSLFTAGPLSDDNAYLVDLKLDGMPLSGFESGVLDYEQTHTCPYVKVEATPLHPDATVEVNFPDPAKYFGSDAERTGSILVTAKDGSTAQTYTIKFNVDGYHLRFGYPQNAIPDGWTTGGTFVASGISNDLYPGPNAMRFTTLDGDLVSRIYKGGDTISFYTKVEMNDASPIQAGEKLTVSIKDNDDADWTEVGSFTSDTEISADWQMKQFIVNDDRDSVQIRWNVTSTNPATRIYLDDIAISGHPRYLDPDYGTDFKDFEQSGILLYPNPASTHLNVYLKGNESGGKLTIYSIGGQQIRNLRLTNQHTLISLDGLKSGLYIVKLTSGSATITEKLIIE